MLIGCSTDVSPSSIATAHFCGDVYHVLRHKEKC
jgi:hypothetical protein